MGREINFEVGMLLGVSALYARMFLCQKRKGRLSFPKGLSPADDATKGLLDVVRKWRDGKSTPTKSTLSRMRSGEYGLAGLRYSELMGALDDPKTRIDWASSCLGDWTGLAEYKNIIRSVDMEVFKIAESKTQLESDHLHVPRSIVEVVRQYAQHGNLEPVSFCKCYLYSLVLFDANPNLKAEPFHEVLYRDADSLQRSFVKLIMHRIQERGKKVKYFAGKMFPRDQSPTKSFENRLYDSKRIIQPDFVQRLAETYHDFVLDEDKKSEQLREVLSKIWNFVIQSAVIMDKIGEYSALNFREIAMEHYAEFRQCADLAYQDFS